MSSTKHPLVILRFSFSLLYPCVSLLFTMSPSEPRCYWRYVPCCLLGGQARCGRRHPRSHDRQPQHNARDGRRVPRGPILGGQACRRRGDNPRRHHRTRYATVEHVWGALVQAEGVSIKCIPSVLGTEGSARVLVDARMKRCGGAKRLEGEGRSCLVYPFLGFAPLTTHPIASPSPVPSHTAPPPPPPLSTHTHTT